MRKVSKEVAQKRKKATKKKANSSRPKRKRLTAAQVASFKELLLKKRKEIVGSVNEIHDEALKKSRLDASGDLSSMPIHMADLGTDNYEQEFALGLMDSEIKLLKEIDDALQRIEDRTYGICEGTGKLINKLRLEAQPWARYSVEHARMLEKGFLAEREEEYESEEEY